MYIYTFRYTHVAHSTDSIHFTVKARPRSGPGKNFPGFSERCRTNGLCSRRGIPGKGPLVPRGTRGAFPGEKNCCFFPPPPRGAGSVSLIRGRRHPAGSSACRRKKKKNHPGPPCGVVDTPTTNAYRGVGLNSPAPPRAENNVGAATPPPQREIDLPSPGRRRGVEYPPPEAVARGVPTPRRFVRPGQPFL